MDRRVALTLVCFAACSSGEARPGNGSSLGVNGTDDGGATAWMPGDTETGPASTSAAPSDSTAAPSETGDDAGTDTTADTTGEGGPALPCADDPAACNAWFLPPDAGAWQAVTIGGPAALAPNSAVTAAFDLEADRTGFVLTADEVIRVDLENRAWLSKTTLAETFPEVNVPLRAAYSVPPPAVDVPGADPEVITLAGDDVAFIYTHEPDGFSYIRATAFGDEWLQPGAPSGADVRAMWIDLRNAEGWVDERPADICGSDFQGDLEAYLGVVTAAQIHVLEVRHCFDFLPAEPYASFDPMALPGAPPVERTGGVLYNDAIGLVTFAVG